MGACGSLPFLVPVPHAIPPATHHGIVANRALEVPALQAS